MTTTREAPATVTTTTADDVDDLVDDLEDLPAPPRPVRQVVKPAPPDPELEPAPVSPASLVFESPADEAAAWCAHVPPCGCCRTSPHVDRGRQPQRVGWSHRRWCVRHRRAASLAIIRPPGQLAHYRNRRKDTQ